MKLGSAPNYKGFHYVKAGISFCLKNPKSVTNLTKLVYPKIAEKFNTNNNAIERAVRASIKSGWHKRDRELAKEIFGNTLQSDEDIPPTSLYIAALAEWLKNQED